MPRSIAYNMTFPETVSIHNIDKMKILVQNGPDNPPGARSIIRSDGKRVDLRFVKSAQVCRLEGIEGFAMA